MLGKGTEGTAPILVARPGMPRPALAESLIEHGTLFNGGERRVVSIDSIHYRLDPWERAGDLPAVTTRSGRRAY